MRRHLWPVCLALLLLLGLSALPHPLAPGGPSGAAWADDDDDDDGGGGDDDDDDDADDRGGFGGREDGDPRPGAFTPPRAGQPAAAPPPPATAAPDEIVTLDLTEADLSVLLDRGFAVIEARPLGNLGAVSRRLRIPAGVTLEEARSAVRALPSGQDADFNHYYRAGQGFDPGCRGIDCPARVMLDWPMGQPRSAACGHGVSIGMIDTGINADHATFAGAVLDVVRLEPGGLDPSRALHGTAVAALLVGDPATRAPGLVPGARLTAIDAFHRAGGDERADVFTLLAGLDLLAGQGVAVINLSLAGPPNAVLERTVTRLVTEADIVLVAAVGNDGPAAPAAYPAAYPPVIAVTAVDRGGNVYRRAVTGDHVDLAAPGVDVWTAASISGARPQTGTSFAVPFVTAAAAILRQVRPGLTAPEVETALRASATDIGDPGPDRVFGAGLVQLDAACRDPG